LRPGLAWSGGPSVTSIERTAYPQFKRLTSARVLQVFFTPAEDEAAWARPQAADRTPRRHQQRPRNRRERRVLPGL
jgi:hypothetical protein